MDGVGSWTPWRKSQRSVIQDSCVEVRWAKSERSSAQGNCVEVASCDCHVQIRNSRDRQGPVLTFTHAEYAAYVGGIRDGEKALIG